MSMKLSEIITMRKVWYRSRRIQIIIAVVIILYCINYYKSLPGSLYRETDLNLTKRKSIIEYIERRLVQALKEDKGTGCEIPRLDPFAKEVTQFDKEMPKVVCKGTDWVKCYHSTCRVVPEILRRTKDIICSYSDILYVNDQKYTFGAPTEVAGSLPYILTASDQVKVKCSGRHRGDVVPSKWTGYAVGFRSTARPKRPPKGREETVNVLILGFDSTAKNGFIRRMPKSYEVLTTMLGATVLNGYNIVGDGTPAALFPLLTGMTELELPDVRKSTKHAGSMDDMPFIFYKLKEDGYRTAYFEDMPWIGTFQYRFNGFKRQPADHYLRPLFMDEANEGRKWWERKESRYCVGDTPQYKLMLNVTEQFFQLDGKKYCFTFIGDIAHDDFNMITTSDGDTAEFLREFQRRGLTEDTLLIVMGDHGPRYAKVRDTFQGKLEERLPLMAIRLPDALIRSRPEVKYNLEYNVNVLTTPHDVYAMVLDVIGMEQHWNTYKVEGADLTRGMTLLDAIPKNRSCSEAGVEPHWCSCLSWQPVRLDDPQRNQSAAAFVSYINTLTDPVRDKCVPRTLTSIEWVMRQRPNAGVLSFVAARDADGYVGQFGARVRPGRENYQIKVVVGPGRGVYEASLTYVTELNRFEVNHRDISRTNAYNDEPKCISDSYPNLNKYCYCND